MSKNSRLYSNKWGARWHPYSPARTGYESDESSSGCRIQTTSTSANSLSVPTTSTDVSTDASRQVASLGEDSERQLPLGPPQRKRGRNWSFTIFGSDLQAAKLTTKDLLELAPRRVTYIVLGYEVSRSTGRGHVQGFLRTQHPREFSGIKKLLGRGIFSPHIEQSSPSARSIEYCKKTTNWEEEGTLPDFAKCRSEFKDEEENVSAAIARKRELYAKLKDGAAPSVLIDDQPEEYAFIHSISKYAAASRVRTYAAQVLYIHGTTGLGKTTTTQLCLDQLNIEYYKKAPGCKWFCGYSFQPIILFDEFASAIPLHRFNAMCDPKPPLLEIKGAQIPNASTHYIILSNRSPDDQYRALKTEKPDEWDAYRRRITSSHHIVNTHDDVTAVRADINMIVSLFVSDLLLDL